MIVDDLRLRPPVGPRRSDDEIRAAALKTLTGATGSAVHMHSHHVKVSHGHLTLTGYAREQAACGRGRGWREPGRVVASVTYRIEIRWKPANVCRDQPFCMAVTVLGSGDATAGDRRRCRSARRRGGVAITSYRASSVLGPTLGRLRRAIRLARRRSGTGGVFSVRRGGAVPRRISPGPVIGSIGAAAPRSPSPVRRPEARRGGRGGRGCGDGVGPSRLRRVRRRATGMVCFGVAPTASTPPPSRSPGWPLVRVVGGPAPAGLH